MGRTPPPGGIGRAIAAGVEALPRRRASVREVGIIGLDLAKIMF
jgi:hypothetical protein